MTVAGSNSQVSGTTDITGILATSGAPAGTPQRVADLNSITVVKRSGALVPFRRDRIARAIELAFRATKGLGETGCLPGDLQTVVESVTNEVVEAVAIEAAKGASVTVEGIQDLVEVKLMNCGHFDVGRNYIIYRDEQKATREDSPRNLKVLRRDGKTAVRFNPMKIASAVERAFRASFKIEGQTPAEVIANVNTLTNNVVARIVEIAATGAQVDIETIQDEVEGRLAEEERPLLPNNSQEDSTFTCSDSCFNIIKANCITTTADIASIIGKDDAYKIITFLQQENVVKNIIENSYKKSPQSTQNIKRQPSIVADSIIENFNIREESHAEKTCYESVKIGCTSFVAIVAKRLQKIINKCPTLE